MTDAPQPLWSRRCVDCRWCKLPGFWARLGGTVATCRSPKVKPAWETNDRVYGRHNVGYRGCGDERRWSMRHAPDRCGEEGQYWESR